MDHVIKSGNISIAIGNERKIDLYILVFSAITVGATIWMGFWAARKSKTAHDFFVAGRNVAGVPAELRNIGLVFQNYALFPHMNGAENIGFGLETRRIRRSEVRSPVHGQVFY